MVLDPPLHVRHPVVARAQDAPLDALGANSLRLRQRAALAVVNMALVHHSPSLGDAQVDLHGRLHVLCLLLRLRLGLGLLLPLLLDVGWRVGRVRLRVRDGLRCTDAEAARHRAGAEAAAPHLAQREAQPRVTRAAAHALPQELHARLAHLGRPFELGRQPRAPRLARRGGAQQGEQGLP